MPFAMVLGEPLTEMPRDLYIPPQAMEVFLDAFEGPLDLLLYLIRRQNLNILDIPIAEITRQYMQYIELMTEMQLDLAGEYLVMAATLAEIKSRMLLPRAAPQGEGLEDDPRAELVRRLQEYERFKQAAQNLDAMPRLERDTWMASAEFNDRRVVRVLPEITLKELLLAFRDVATRSEMFAHHHIHREPLSVRARMSDILASLSDRMSSWSSRGCSARGRPHGRGGDLHRHARAAARGAARDRAERSLRAHPRVRGAIRAGGRDGSIDSTAEDASAADARLLRESAGARRRPEDDEDHEEDAMNTEYTRKVVEAAMLAAGRSLSLAEIGAAVRSGGSPGQRPAARGAARAGRIATTDRGIELLETAQRFPRAGAARGGRAGRRGCGRSGRRAIRARCSRRSRSSPTASRSRAPRSSPCAAWR